MMIAYLITSKRGMVMFLPPEFRLVGRRKERKYVETEREAATEDPGAPAADH